MCDARKINDCYSWSFDSYCSYTIGGWEKCHAKMRAGLFNAERRFGTDQYNWPGFSAFAFLI